MSKGSKEKYTAKQKTQAKLIENSYEKRGVGCKTAKQRAWQTVNKQSGGGEKSGAGRDVSAKAKRAARQESGRRAADARVIGSDRVQKVAPRHRASASD